MREADLSKSLGVSLKDTASRRRIPVSGRARDFRFHQWRAEAIRTEREQGLANVKVSASTEKTGVEIQLDFADIADVRVDRPSAVVREIK